ncbi:uncharacterized protein [Eurosta solidaginis]|uniref:uncharacterized protein n=1 Tax=Eurosta solidaginis TaxID=178769 RepID=UPI003530E1D8
MRFLEYSSLNIFSLFICITLTNAAVICIDVSTLDKVLPTGVDKINIQRRNATAIGDVDERTELDTDMHSHIDEGITLNGKNNSQSQVTKFLQTVQDTLEKAKPWVVEIEKEAKRLEETAKRFSVGVIRDLGKFVDRLIGGPNGVGGGSNKKPTQHSDTSTSSSTSMQNTDNKTPDVEVTTAAATVAEVLPDVVVVDANHATGLAAAAVTAALPAVVEISDAENEISGQQDDSTLCPDGFVADVNGICLRNHK